MAIRVYVKAEKREELVVCGSKTVWNNLECKWQELGLIQYLLHFVELYNITTLQVIYIKRFVCYDRTS